MSEAKTKTKSEKGSSSGKGKLVKIIALVVGVIVLVGGAVGGTYYYVMKNGKTVIKVVKEEPIDELTFGLDEVLLNLADTDSKRYVKAKVFIGYDKTKEKKLAPELEEKKAILRDAVNSVLSGKKAAEISTPKGKEDLKKDIMARVNPILVNGKATNIYFYDILIQ